MTLLWAAVISSLHFQGPVTADGGDYVTIPFDVPAGTAELRVEHADGGASEILDWGVWAPEGFRGWGGGNSEPAVIGVDESSRSYLEGALTPGTWTLVIGKAKLVGGAGSYDITVTFYDAATLTPLPRAAFDPVVVRAAPGWYAGDLHVHSEESGDAAATLPQIATLARDRGLDFVVVTDHNTVSHHGRLAAYQAELTDLLLVRGIEVTTYGGHGNAIGVSAYVDHRVGLDGVSATTIADAVAAQGGLFSVNHPTLALGDTCIGCAWVHADTPWDEVASFEIQTGPYDVTGVLFTPQAIEMWDGLLDQGYRLAAVGGSDDHRAGMDESGTQSAIGSPTTMVYADELSEAGVVAAIRAGHTVVKLRGPDDPMVELEAGRGADLARVGATVEGPVELRGRVTGGGIGGTLTFYRNGAPAEAFTVDADPFEVTLAVEPPPGDVDDRFRLELVDGVPRVVTSHIWVRATGEPIPEDAGAGTDAGVGTPTGGGCSCRAGRRDGGPAWPLFVGLALLIASRRR
ncbi:MAG: CehA/McbA family metallohydrolase [Myxococcales bacterium]|nr:CehA/McbA family metallohydrolase [Myxococcales bacterium]